MVNVNGADGRGDGESLRSVGDSCQKSTSSRDFIVVLWGGGGVIPLAGVRPLKLEILSKRLIPSSLPRASRRSLRKRAARWAGDSSDADIVPITFTVQETRILQAGR